MKRCPQCNRVESDETLKFCRADGTPLISVVVYAGHDKEKAFAWLEKAFADRSVFLVFLKLEPLMEPLHSHPRWQGLERRVVIAV